VVDFSLVPMSHLVEVNQNLIMAISPVVVQTMEVVVKADQSFIMEVSIIEVGMVED
jgi:hypothetical protein